MSIAASDSLSTVEDVVGGVTTNLLVNDVRADGAALVDGSITSVGAPSNGNVTLISQVDTVKLLKGAEAGGAVTITVNGTEFGIAAAASLSTARDNLLSAIQSNSDLSQITASAVGTDSLTLKANIGGQAIVTSSSNSDLAAVVDTVKNGSAVYQPNANFNGSDSFTYTVSNGLIPPSFSSAKVNVSVSPVNDAPEATIDFGEAVTLSLIHI